MTAEECATIFYITKSIDCSSFPRKRESMLVPKKGFPIKRQPFGPAWIPAFAGMTTNILKLHLKKDVCMPSAKVGCMEDRIGRNDDSEGNFK